MVTTADIEVSIANKPAAPDIADATPVVFKHADDDLPDILFDVVDGLTRVLHPC